MLDLNMNYLECIPVLSPNPDDGSSDGGDDTSSGGDDTGTDGGSDDGTTGGGDDSIDDGSDDNKEERDIYEDSENPGQEYQYLCEQILLETTEDEFDEEGNLIVEEKVLVCHYPNNDAGKAHTICIGRPGWENGHSNHEKDHLGACNELDF